jgi:hypothetical protein
MAPVRARLVMGCVIAGAALSACSPEARRARDGGRGADPGNKRVVEGPHVDPKAADTTLWPGRAPTPLERLEAGTMYPPPPPVQLAPSPAAKSPSPPEQRAFDKSARDPRRPERR